MLDTDSTRHLWWWTPLALGLIGFRIATIAYDEVRRYARSPLAP